MKNLFRNFCEKRKSKKFAQIERAVLLETKGVKRWYDADDDLPRSNEWLLGYSEIFGTYHICKFYPSRGWVGMSGDALTAISHWCEDELFLPFEIRNEVSAYYAEKHGFKLQ